MTRRWRTRLELGAPLWTWPVDEQVIDLLQKRVHAFTTGFIADRLVAGPPRIPEPRQPWETRWLAERVLIGCALTVAILCRA
jgi:hypothetical protein